MDLELLTTLRGRKRQLWTQLLHRTELEPEAPAEQTALLWDGDVLAAAGSRQGNVLKYLAVDPDHQGEGLLATVLTALRQAAFGQGHRHLFVYTKPGNEALFRSLFFHPVARTGQVLLLEDRPDGMAQFLASLPQAVPGETVGAAVMNCDPFTRGHRYLIEQASASCDRMYVFVLSEDRGRFPAADRLELVRRGTADLPNVTVLPTGPYLISSATFPTYFIKDKAQAGQIQCALDIEIFVRHLAPRLGITRRFVGAEPLCPVTAQYNAALQATLPQHGIAVAEIPRLELDGRPISASAVRAALDAGDWDTVRTLVPQTTFAYLQTMNKEETP